MSATQRPSAARCTALATGLVLAASVPAARAELEEVVVTAQKREQAINDVGITINVFSPEKLRSFGIARPDDLESMVPGLTVTNQQPAGAPVYTIRGVGFNDFTTSASSTVGIYFDGTSVPYPVMTRGVLFDLARVEVLKGPQGDLYGRNTTAGQINFVSNRPTPEFEAGVRIGYDNYETLDLEGFMSGPLGERSRGRLAIKSVNSDRGWQESVSRPGDRLGARDELAVRGVVDMDVTENIRVSLRARVFADRSESIAATATAIAPFFDQSSLPASFSAQAADWSVDHRPRNDNLTRGLAAELAWDLGGMRLTSITSYDDFERDGTTFDTSGVNYEDADITNTSDITVFAQELRLESAGDSDFYWLAGLYYADDRIKENYLMEFRESFGLTGVSRYRQESETLAAFGHVEYAFTERARLTLGLRYTDEQRSWSGCTYDTGDGLMAGFYNFFVYPVFLEPLFPGAAPIAPGGCTVFNDVAGTTNVGQFTPFSDSIGTDDLMGKITFDYRPAADLLVFATISNGFKSGGFNGAIALSHQMLQPYDKEELTAYELGLKSTVLNGDLQLNAALFLYDYKDKQEATVFIAPVGGVVGFDNVPKSRIRGAELEMSWALTERLRWDLGLAWLDTRITKWIAVCPAGLLGAPVDLPDGCPAESVFGNVLTYDASGDGLNNAPEWQAATSLSYRQPLGDDLTLLAAVDVSYKGDNIGSIAAPDTEAKQLPFSAYLPDYTLVNARLQLSRGDDTWSVTVWARNLTDKYYWHSTAASNSTATRLNGMPRTYGVTLGYHF
ncbi:MAG: TonB-dependent receptor [Gammaproteobacteria bacterium]|nr:TonB-dependent receptor [Gammaproteobacteria bacterium]